MGQQEVLKQLFSNKDLMNKLTWDRVLMLNEAKKRGLKVNDTEVVTYIARSPIFIHKGSFDTKAYEYFVKKTLGLSPRAFEEAIREFILIDKLKENITFNVMVSDADLVNAAQDKIEVGDLEYFVLEADIEDPLIIVSDDEIRAYYQKNKQEFILPMQMDIEYLSFSFGSFEEKKGLRPMAKIFLDQIKAKDNDLDSIKEKTGQDPVDAGLLTQGQIVNNFSFEEQAFKTLFKMSQGQIGLFEDSSVSGKMYIMKIKEKIASRMLKLDQTREVIQNNIKVQKADQKVQKDA
jgi:hypothetical protein